MEVCHKYGLGDSVLDVHGMVFCFSGGYSIAGTTDVVDHECRRTKVYISDKLGVGVDGGRLPRWTCTRHRHVFGDENNSGEKSSCVCKKKE